MNEIQPVVKVADGDFMLILTLIHFAPNNIVKAHLTVFEIAFKMEHLADWVRVEAQTFLFILLKADIIGSTYGSLFDVGVDEVVLDIVDGGIETDVDEGIAALLNADVESAGRGHGLVKLVVSEPVGLLLPLRTLAFEAIDFLARLAVLVFPDHNVEILVVGIVQGVVEQQLHALDGVVVSQIEADGKLCSSGTHTKAQLGSSIVISIVVVHA